MAPTFLGTSGSRVLVLFAVLCLSTHGVVARIGAADTATPALDRRRDAVEIGSNHEPGGGDRFVEEATRSLSARVLLDAKAPSGDGKAKVGAQHSTVTGDVAPVGNKTTAGPTKTAANETKTGAGKAVPTPPPAGTPPPPPKTDTGSHNHTDVSPPPSPPDASRAGKGEATAAHEGKCDHGPVIAKLQAPGEDGNYDYTLTVQNDGGNAQLNVSIATTKVVKANPEALELTKGETKRVTITVVDREAARLGASINVSWGEGECQVDVPPGRAPGAVVAHPSYFSFLTLPETGALVIGGAAVFVLILGAAGVWGCVSWRARARRHGEGDAKYQELEMGLPSVEASKKEDEASPSADGWDEVWEDDDWEDTEAVRSSSTSLTLSAKGLNSRRANKDGWDSSWDD